MMETPKPSIELMDAVELLTGLYHEENHFITEPGEYDLTVDDERFVISKLVDERYVDIFQANGVTFHI